MDVWIVLIHRPFDFPTDDALDEMDVAGVFVNQQVMHEHIAAHLMERDDIEKVTWVKGRLGPWELVDRTRTHSVERKEARWPPRPRRTSAH